MLEDELDLEEWEAGALKRIAPGIDTLVLGNQAGTDVDEAALAEALGRVQGIEGIKNLRVLPSSRVQDVRFIGALPALATMMLQGQRLVSLDGIESFRHGRYLSITTGKNRKRDISGLAQAPVTRLRLDFAKGTDLEAIARSSTLRHLDLNGPPNLDLAEWGNVPLEVLALWNGAIEALGNTERIATLRSVTLNGCRKLERFEGQSGNVTWMTVQDCHRLDWRTLSAFRGLQYLGVIASRTAIPLSTFSGLEELRSVALWNCKVEVDVNDLKRSAPRLEELDVQQLKDQPTVELSKANPGVLISNGRRAFRGGVAVSK
jgi:hypothetical protein